MDKKKRVRRPIISIKQIYGYREPMAFLEDHIVGLVETNLYPRECRKLAAWLLRAATWLEHQPSKGGDGDES